MITGTNKTMHYKPHFPSLCRSSRIQFVHRQTHKHCNPEMLTLAQQFLDLYIPGSYEAIKQQVLHQVYLVDLSNGIMYMWQ